VKPFAFQARAKTAARGKRFTRYLEDLIMNDIAAGGSGGNSKIQRTLQDLIGRPVDIAQRSRLRNDMVDDVDRDRMQAF
jgi:hypothetical protein